MEWTTEKTLKLIEDYRNAPELWNNHNVDYRDNRMKYDTLRRLAGKHKTNVDAVKNKLKNLRSAFHRERKRIEKWQKSAAASSSSSRGHKRTNWFAYEPLRFLQLDDDDLIARETTAAASTISDGDHSEGEDEEEEGNDHESDLGFPDTSNQETDETDRRYNPNMATKRKFYLSPKKRTRTEKYYSATSLSNRKEEEAYNILQGMHKRDEFVTYGEHVANELRSLKPRTRIIVKHLINNLFYDAAMGKYDDDEPSTSTTRPSTHFQNCESSMASAYDTEPDIKTIAHSS